MRVALAAALLLGAAGPALAKGDGVVLQMTTKLKVDQHRPEHPDRFAPGGRGRVTFRVKGDLATVRKRMLKTIGGGDTPSFELIPRAPGIRMELTSKPKGHQYGAAAVPVYKVSGLGPQGILPVDALFPASAHLPVPVDGLVADNEYLIQIEHEAPSPVLGHLGRTVTTVPAVVADGRVTVSALDLQLKPGRNTVTVSVRQKGHSEVAAAPYAFVEGRTKVFIWDGR